MTTDVPVRTRTARYFVFGLIGIVFLVIGVGLYFFLNRPPQMGTSEEVFHTVDALYTAVRNHDEQHLTECEQRLLGYREAGKLPIDAAESLAGIVRTARTGSWERAAGRLYEFMLAQRRDGAAESKPKATKPGKAKPK